MRWVFLGAFVLLLVGSFFFFKFSPYSISKPSVENIPLIEQTENKNEAPKLTTIATGLDVPWAIVFLPDQSILVSERVGRVKLIKDGKVSQVATIPEVRQSGESGLHGITLHPDFEKNKFVYLYYTYSNSGNESRNRVSRYTFKDNNFSDPQIIVDNIPGAIFHDGGRVKFGPDKYLYITTGDAQQPSLSQDRNSLAGKILRVTDEGKPAPNNPFGSMIYSYGHRNPQGITWDENGDLWETEHGDSTTDELNIIMPGKNYGWPEIRGDQFRDNMIQPILQSGNDTWAPTDIAFLNGSLYFGGLRGQTLYKVNPQTKEKKEYLKGELGRIRETIVGPDGMLYITTSNRDSRGKPSSDDDKIIRVNPGKLSQTITKQASFLIFTNGIKRIFTDSKYHNRSEDVFITSENPSVIIVKKEGITWGDFFNTLPSPMKVEEKCLYTGSGQTFCNDNQSNLKFYLNGEKINDLLNREINSGDKLLISFGPSEDSEIKNQLFQIP